MRGKDDQSTAGERIAKVIARAGLASRRDLPGIDDLKAAGLLDPLDEALVDAALESGDEED